MTRDDIISMAREAGSYPTVATDGALLLFSESHLERFAALVAAAERERLKWDGLHSCHPECDRPACVHTRKAVEAEREACAKLCEAQENRVVERHPARIEFDPNSMTARKCAAAIRARGQQ